MNEIRDLFNQYQQTLLKLANNPFGRKFLGISHEVKDKIIGLSDNAYFVQKGRNKYQATFRCYPLFAKRLGYALTSVDIARDWFERNINLYKPMPDYQGLLNYVGLTRDSWFPNIMLASPETFFSGAGDGYVGYGDASTWNEAHDATSGNYFSSIATTATVEGRKGVTKYQAFRGFLPTNTAGLPDTANITDVTERIVVDNIYGSPGPAVIVETSQASTSELVADDFNNIAAVEGSDVVAVASDGNPMTFTLNLTGRGWISKTGWSMIGLRDHDYDVHDVPPSQGATTGFNFRTSEYAGTTSDPKLDVTYSLPSGGAGMFFGA